MTVIPLKRYNLFGKDIIEVYGAFMLKDYLKKHSKSIYALSKESGVAYSTLNDLANGKVDIDQCKISLLRSLSRALGLSLDEVIAICSTEGIATKTSQGIDVKVTVRNKSYHAEFVYDEELVDVELCKVREESSFYIDEIAKWRSEEYIRDRRISEWE